MTLPRLIFILISANPTVENAFSIPIVTGSWQSIDIPLSSYTANLDRVFQFKTVGNGTCTLTTSTSGKHQQLQAQTLL